MNAIESPETEQPEARQETFQERAHELKERLLNATQEWMAKEIDKITEMLETMDPIDALGQYPVELKNDIHNDLPQTSDKTVH
jgi:hypothetical protein